MRDGSSRNRCRNWIFCSSSFEQRRSGNTNEFEENVDQVKEHAVHSERPENCCMGSVETEGI